MNIYSTARTCLETIAQDIGLAPSDVPEAVYAAAVDEIVAEMRSKAGRATFFKAVNRASKRHLLPILNGKSLH